MQMPAGENSIRKEFNRVETIYYYYYISLTLVIVCTYMYIIRSVKTGIAA